MPLIITKFTQVCHMIINNNILSNLSDVVVMFLCLILIYFTHSIEENCSNIFSKELQSLEKGCGSYLYVHDIIGK